MNIDQENDCCVFVGDGGWVAVSVGGVGGGGGWRWCSSHTIFSHLSLRNLQINMESFVPFII